MIDNDLIVASALFLYALGIYHYHSGELYLCWSLTCFAHFIASHYYYYHYFKKLQWGTNGPRNRGCRAGVERTPTPTQTTGVDLNAPRHRRVTVSFSPPFARERLTPRRTTTVREGRERAPHAVWVSALTSRRTLRTSAMAERAPVLPILPCRAQGLRQCEHPLCSRLYSC
jgi:hypothetical protein